ncbi:hypothetical protein KIN20_032516 [Parelaphostrongylus tenuis]|uniref:Uncharacterized protein n=1 Tax=Parelaphostrongylus tenuis TaxID=148309 RepID=A0AAD5R6N5_PARTN|nr:hypothetical protein KIN20_032516 [Parelaphostrongylus tenuis]
MEVNYRRQSSECANNLAKAFTTMQETFDSGTLGRNLLQVKFKNQLWSEKSRMESLPLSQRTRNYQTHGVDWHTWT